MKLKFSKRKILVVTIATFLLIVLLFTRISPSLGVRSHKNISTQVVTLDGVKTYILVGGDHEKQPLIFLHAMGAQENWLPSVVGEFSKSYFIIAPEIPGYIRSETPSPVWSYEEYGEWLKDLEEFYHIEKPVIVGNSLGGTIATVFSNKYPEKVKTLVLLDSATTQDFKETSFVSYYKKFNTVLIRSKLIPLFVKKLVIENYLGTPKSFLSDEEVKNKIAMINKTREFTTRYEDLNVPTFLVWGRDDTLIHPISYAREIATRLQQGRLIEYKGSVTTIYKNPEYVVDIIRAAIE